MKRTIESLVDTVTAYVLVVEEQVQAVLHPLSGDITSELSPVFPRFEVKDGFYLVVHGRLDAGREIPVRSYSKDMIEAWNELCEHSPLLYSTQRIEPYLRTLDDCEEILEIKVLNNADGDSSITRVTTLYSTGRDICAINQVGHFQGQLQNRLRENSIVLTKELFMEIGKANSWL